MTITPAVPIMVLKFRKGGSDLAARNPMIKIIIPITITDIIRLF